MRVGVNSLERGCDYRRIEAEKCLRRNDFFRGNAEISMVYVRKFINANIICKIIAFDRAILRYESTPLDE